MKCFCTPRQKCPLHHEEYEPEIHGPQGRLADQAEGLLELTEARDRENQGGVMEEIRNLLRKRR